ncbi:NAD-dependent epimerase/dehydratase family protein [Devosia neptuniae]|uniref:NAD-dependent epimerase/dehydratase family protein n=1 Tax=Devosia neptuniae TaxID=191302 RepID=UPI0022B05413|nr:NAD-dependent epimerase/dehydratase family protein [Devosia neptuniae]MCZ4347998.1 NAD-dependent epimerase/dehydratase family protein [Devosia neptuniae]|tara:strand:+ start:5239 stop:6255 length:1017 start_codon:yes stop_codon:yes gene_type:complete
MKFFVTGSAGFIGFHLAKRLLMDGHEVLGFDGMTPYYDPALKQRRHELLGRWNSFHPVIGMLENKVLLDETVFGFKPDIVVHLGAQAGVRYSIEHPDVYIQSNLVGTANVLEAARNSAPQHLLIASTSSVYGGNQSMPFREADRTDFPVSLYAATKKACEAMSHSYAHLFRIPTTCFRFFTVYGPWGRPDMALFKFVAAIEKGEPIDVFGEGKMRRDFTYVDDLVEGIVRLVNIQPEVGLPVEFAGGLDSLSPVAPWRSVNIAGGQPVELMDFINLIEKAVGKAAIKNFLPMQQGDVVETFADSRLLQALTNFQPCTGVEQGVSTFVEWYQDWCASKK